MSLKKLKERQANTETAIDYLREKALKRLRDDERPFINCKSCKSRMARKPTMARAALECPICGVSFLLKGEQKTLTRLNQNLTDLTISINTSEGRGHGSATTDNA